MDHAIGPSPIEQLVNGSGNSAGDGKGGAVPFPCLSQLLMTLPAMIGIALRRSYGDDSHRLAYPIKSYRLEVGEPNSSEVGQLILSLETKDGFSLSFAASAQLLTDLGRSLIDEADAPSADIAPSVRLS